MLQSISISHSKALNRAVLVIVAVLSISYLSKSDAQGAEAAYLSDEVSQLEKYVYKTKKQAAEYRELAEEARSRAKSSIQNTDKEGWLDDAARYEKNAQELEAEARRNLELITEKRKKLEKLQAPEKFGEITDKGKSAPDASPSKTTDSSSESESFTIPLDQLIGEWTARQLTAEDTGNDLYKSDNPAGTPFVIVEKNPGENSNEIEAHSLDRVWSGEYSPSPGPDEPILRLKYTPKIEEINQEIPDWAREKVANKLEWTLELFASGTCGTPKLEADFYPGKVEWQTGEGGEEKDAWIAGNGEARQYELQQVIPDVELPSYGAARIFIRERPIQDVSFDSIEVLTKRQKFYIYLTMPEEMANDVGNTAQIRINGRTSGDSTTVTLTRGNSNANGVVVYSRFKDFAYMIADSVDGIPTLNLLSQIQYYGGWQPRLDLDVENGEVVEFSYKEAKVAFPVYNSWVQLGLANHEDAGDKARETLSFVLQDSKASKATKENAVKKLQMIKNYEVIAESEHFHDYIKFKIGEEYFNRLIPHSEDVMELTWPLKGTMVRFFSQPVSDETKRRPTSGKFSDVYWTAHYERDLIMYTESKARDKYQKKAYDEIGETLAYASYIGLLGLAMGTGPVVTISTTLLDGSVKAYEAGLDWKRITSITPRGYDAFGKRTDSMDVLASTLEMGLMTILFNIVGKHAKLPSHSALLRPGLKGSYSRMGNRAELKTHLKKYGETELKQLSPAVRAQLPKLTKTQVENLTLKEQTSGDMASESLVSCAPRSSPKGFAPQPGPISSLPAQPGGINQASFERLSGIRTMYGKKAELAGDVSSKPFPDQSFGSCMASCTRRSIKSELDLNLRETDMFSIMFRNNVISRSGRNPLKQGYKTNEVVQFLNFLGAKTNVFKNPAGKFKPEALANWMKRGWYVRVIVKPLHSKYTHAVELRRFVRNSSNEITYVEFFDPAYGLEVRVPICQYNKLVTKRDVLVWRWGSS